MSRRSTRSGAFDVASVVPGLQSTSNGIAQSTVMYINSQYNHPAFSKLYLGPNLSQNGKSYGASSAVPKPPKAPEKPLMPYMRYSRKVWDDVKAHQPELKLWEIGKIIGKMWRELQASDKQLYVDEYEAEKLEYQEQMKSYHNSPAYQIFLQAKSRAEAEAAAENRAAPTEESCMSIEPIDDVGGDTDEGYSVKHIAAARFQRNNRLMQDVLADSSVIPSGRGIVTEQRLNVLKNQVLSLEKHQTKLQKELLNIEKNHANTKRKWKSQANDFAAEMKRLRGMTPQEYYIEYKKKQQQIQQQQQLKAASKELPAENNETPKANDKPDQKTEESKNATNEGEQNKTESQSEMMEINTTDSNSKSTSESNEDSLKDASGKSENEGEVTDESVTNDANNNKEHVNNNTVETDAPTEKCEDQQQQTEESDEKSND